MPDGMEAILDSVRNTANKWVNTQTPLIQDAKPGDMTLKVLNSHRFLQQDDLNISSPVSGKGETLLTVDTIQDINTILLSSPVKFEWDASDNCIVRKLFDNQMLQGIYLGEPQNMMYPCISVKGTSLNSEWLTIKSTKEDYKVEVTIYVQSSGQESGYRALMRMTDSLIYGLKRNLYPLVGPYQVYSILSDIHAGDSFIKVSDTSWFEKTGVIQRVIIEDESKQSELWVADVIDNETLQIQPTTGCDFSLSDNPIVIVVPRFIFNSWPSNTTYGELFKGTLLKSARISWFANEEKIHLMGPRETYLH